MSFSSVRAFFEANKNKRWMPGFMVLLFLIGAIVALIILVVLRIFIVQRRGF
jgi:RsiW-degrading membrane proteinase PrsW (M82 family)